MNKAIVYYCKICGVPLEDSNTVVLTSMEPLKENELMCLICDGVFIKPTDR